MWRAARIQGRKGFIQQTMLFGFATSALASAVRWLRLAAEQNLRDSWSATGLESNVPAKAPPCRLSRLSGIEQPLRQAETDVPAARSGGGNSA